MVLSTILRRLGRYVLPGLLALVVQPLGAEPPGPRELLQTLASKASGLNYQGSFTYQHGSSLETFRVTHWVEDGVRYERLRYLSGPEREVVRHGKSVDCASMGSMMLQGRLTQAGERFADLEQFYQFDVVGVDRVAARLTVALLVKPRDPHRYGYVLFIDPETGLLLKSLLLDEQEQLVVERFQFVELQLDPPLDDLLLEPVARRHRVANPHLSGCNLTEPGEPEHWRLGWVPPGFAFAGQQQVREHTDMLMYTDGLAAFSVFLEPNTGPISVEGYAQRGATNAYMGLVNRDNREYRVTVVGEVPVAVAERVSQNIAATNSGQNQSRRVGAP